MNFAAGKTRQELPAFYERRSESDYFKYVELIADKDFRPKKTVFVNSQGNMDETKHAIFVASLGDMIIRVSESKEILTFQLFVIKEINALGDKFQLVTEEIYKENDPTNIIDNTTTNKKEITEFIEAARAKLKSDVIASFYHINTETPYQKRK